MTITTSYAFTTGSNFAFHGSGNFTNLDLASLSDGGYVADGYYYGHTDFFEHDSSNTYTHAVYRATYGGTSNAIAQLHDGNLAVVQAGGADVQFAIYQTDGTVVTAAGGMGFASLSPEVTSVDVAALAGGGFAAVLENDYSSTEHDIQVMVSNSDGSSIAQFGIDFSGLNNGPGVAGLNNGNIAIAWTHDDGLGNTLIDYEIIQPGGTVVKAETTLDSDGTTNQSVNLVALPNGSFGVVYEDNGWGNSEITFAKVSADGTSITYLNVTSGDGVADHMPEATVLSNGDVAIIYQADQGSGNNDIVATVIDPSTMTVLGTTSALDVTEASNDVGPTIAAMLNGQMVTGWDEGGDVGRILTLTRTKTGDNANNTLTGDDLTDKMYGGSKGSDTLTGAGADDSLYGGKGNDSLDGGTGADAMFGGSGKDTASYADASAGVFAFLNNPGGNTGDATGDTYSSIENLTGSHFTDVLVGNSGGNTLIGGLDGDAMYGGNGRDKLIGDDGNDLMSGGGSSDTLNGGAGSDTFIYADASDSTGPNYDTITGFNANADTIAVIGGVSGVDPAVVGGALSKATFDSDLGNAIGVGQLAKHHAVLFEPDSGDLGLAHHIFLIIDINGHAGYQTNKDIVIDVTGGSHLNTLDTDAFGTVVAAPSIPPPPLLEGAGHQHMSTLASNMQSDHYGAGHFLV